MGSKGLPLFLLVCLISSAAASTTSGYTCTGSCGYGGSSYTWCYIPGGTSGWTGYYNCPSGTFAGVSGCYDYCGYTYEVSSSCTGSCSATSGRACGSTSGTCAAAYICTDNSNSAGSHCSGSAPSAIQASCSTSSYSVCTDSSSGANCFKSVGDCNGAAISLSTCTSSTTSCVNGLTTQCQYTPSGLDYYVRYKR